MEERNGGETGLDLHSRGVISGVCAKEGKIQTFSWVSSRRQYLKITSWAFGAYRHKQQQQQQLRLLHGFTFTFHYKINIPPFA